MLDYVLMRHMPGSIYSDSAYRCQGCGKGPVMAGDGFLMNRCLNCGRYHRIVYCNWRTTFLYFRSVNLYW